MPELPYLPWRSPPRIHGRKFKDRYSRYGVTPSASFAKDNKHRGKSGDDHKKRGDDRGDGDDNDEESWR